MLDKRAWESPPGSIAVPLAGSLHSAFSILHSPQGAFVGLYPSKEHDAAALLVYNRTVPTLKPKPARSPAETDRPETPPALA
jgi:hypothetical protein